MESQKKEYIISYPRRQLVRGFLRFLGRIIFKVFFHIRITGLENFPTEGKLLLVGNHVAMIEAALMVIFTPWQVELLGAGDLPQEGITEVTEWLYGYIPIDRGNVDRSALRKALDVLKQGGRLGIFPEGGFWEPGAMRAQPGVSWLSYRAEAPVLPIAFGGTLGALTAALKFKRPPLTINIGEVIPAAKIPEDQKRKPYFQSYANEVMQAVKKLLPPDDPSLRSNIKNERFELQVAAQDQEGQAVSTPQHLRIQHSEALTKFLHRPTILKIFRANLKLAIDALQNLHTNPSAAEIYHATRLVIEALEGEYPYLLVYRFGAVEAEKMQLGLEELLALAQWATQVGVDLKITPIQRYYSVKDEKEVVQIEQGVFENWM